jgi:hypothetical protein
LATEIVTWGGFKDDGGEPVDLSGVTNGIAIAAGEFHLLALHGTGEVSGWGRNYRGVTSVPVNLTNVVAIAAGFHHSLALTEDGRVVAWGEDEDGQLDVPDGLTNVVAISAGEHNNLALTADGRVVAWGGGEPWADDPPSTLLVPLAAQRNVVAIAAGGMHCSGGHNLALTGDGRVVAWGSNLSGLCADIQRYSGQAIVPHGLKGVVAIAGGGNFSLIMKGDGEVSGWGGWEPLPSLAQLNKAVTISAGSAHAFGVSENGRVVEWGSSWTGGVTNVPSALSNVVAVAAGGWGDSLYGAALVGLPPGLAAPQLIGPHALMATTDWPFQKRFLAKNGASTFGAAGLPSGLELDSTQGLITGVPHQAGRFEVTLTATNSIGANSRQITIHVNDPMPFIEEGTLVVVGVAESSRVRVPAYFVTSYEAFGLPAGLSVHPATGLLEGVTEEEGTFPIALTVSNRFAEATGTFVLKTMPLASGPILMDPQYTASRDFEFTLVGAPGNYQVEISSDLVNWSALRTAVNTHGSTQVRLQPWFGPLVEHAPPFFRAIFLPAQ